MNFLKGALKISVAIVVAVAALAILAGAVALTYRQYQKSKADRLETVKPIELDLTEQLQMKLVGKTKLVDERLYAEFIFEGYPEYLESAANKRESAGIQVVFLDADGFKIHEKQIPLHHFTLIHSSGSVTGLRYSYDEYMSVERYSRYQNITVTWNLYTKSTKPTAAPTDPEVVSEAADHCAPNISRAERIRRLSKHGQVRQTGSGEYRVGSRHLQYLSGDYLYNCR